MPKDYTSAKSKLLLTKKKLFGQSISELNFLVVCPSILSKKDYILGNCKPGHLVRLVQDKNTNEVGVLHQDHLIGFIGKEDIPKFTELFDKKHVSQIENIGFNGKFVEIDIKVAYYN